MSQVHGRWGGRENKPRARTIRLVPDVPAIADALVISDPATHPAIYAHEHYWCQQGKAAIEAEQLRLIHATLLPVVAGTT